MSQTKYPLPDDLKTQLISIVRGYNRRVRLYHDRRDAIIYGSPEPPDGQPKSNCKSDIVASKLLELEKIEQLFDTKAMRAVEQAKVQIGNDLLSERQRQKLTDAIWDSCIHGRNFRFNYYDLAVSKSNFYERRRKFLYHIATYLHFL